MSAGILLQKSGIPAFAYITYEKKKNSNSFNIAACVCTCRLRQER
jgi:hypothetical protein